jgi:hypothetical protein
VCPFRVRVRGRWHKEGRFRPCGAARVRSADSAQPASVLVRAGPGRKLGAAAGKVLRRVNTMDIQIIQFD